MHPDSATEDPEAEDKSAPPSPSASLSPTAQNLKSVVAALRVPSDNDDSPDDASRKRRAAARLKTSAGVVSALQPPSAASEQDRRPQSFRKTVRRRSSSFIKHGTLEEPDVEEVPERSPSGKGAVSKLRGLIIRKQGSSEGDDLEDSGDGKSPAGQRGLRRRSSGKLKTGVAALAAMTALRSELEMREEEEDPQTRVQNPDEVILPPEGDESDEDDEEEEEAERDFLSALQRVQSSGKLSMKELLAFKELRQQDIFKDETHSTILAGFRSAKYVEVAGNEVLWSRFSELCDSVLEADCPLVLLLSGKVSIAKPGLPEGEKLHKGGVVNTKDPDVLGVVVEQECSLLYVDMPRVEQDMADSRAAREQVERELRRGRQPATWPEELINQLVASIRDLPFFEDFALPQLRGLARGLRFQSAKNGEALPRPLHLPPTVEPEPPSLVVLWAGTAGKYRRVTAGGDELIAAQIYLLAVEQGAKKTQKTGTLVSPSPGEKTEKKDGMLPDLVPDLLDDEVKPDKEDGKIYLKRYGDLQKGFVLGQRDIVDPGGPAMHEPTVRCEGRCKILRLTRRDYLHCLKEMQVEKHRIVHALRNIPPSRPGEPHQRSEEQLSLLAKLVRNTPELKNFERPTLMQVLGAATYVNAAKGHVLCKQGEIGDQFYAIIEGMVSIHVRPPKIGLEEGHAMNTVAEKSGKSAFVKAMLSALTADRAARPQVPAQQEPAKAGNVEPQPQTSASQRSDTSKNLSPSSSVVAPVSSGGSGLAPVPVAPKGAHRGRRHGVRLTFHEDSDEAKRSSLQLQVPLKRSSRTPSVAEELSTSDREESSLPTPPLSPPALASPEPEVAEEEEASSENSLGASPSISPMPSEKDPRRRSLRARLQDRGGLFWQGVRTRMKGPSSRKTQDLGKMVNRLGAGAAFGAKTLLKKEARTASVMTVEPTKLLVVTREDYVALLGSMEEAKRREAAEFLCRHVLQVVVPPGAASKRAIDHLHPALRQRMVRTSKAMKSCTLDRGSVLLRHGEPECKEVTILRQGAVAFCYPPGHEGKEAPRSARTPRYAAAAMGASQIVTTPGELIGVYSAIFKDPEPATVRVESATCDIYRVPWVDLQRVLTQRNLNLLRERMIRAHGARCETLAVHTPKEMFKVTANESLQNTLPSKEQQAVKKAFEEAFDAVSQFAEGSGEGLTSEAFIEAIKSSKNFGLQSAKKPKPKAVPKPLLGGAAAREAARKAAYEKGLEKALAQLHEATQKAGLWESLQTSDVEMEAARSRQPQQMASSHVRAQFLKVLKNEHFMVMERFIAEAVLDPLKPDLNAWLQKYMKSDFLRKHPDLQDLQLILRRQLMTKNAVTTRRQLQDVSSG